MKEPDHSYIAGLVLRAQHNDSDAFAEIYALTYNKVYNYACHYLKDTYLAQDALQEVYISALKNIGKLNDPLLFVAWLNQISFHICYDICKKRNNGYGLVDDAILELVSDDHIDSNPEDHAVKKDENSALSLALEALPINERQVIIMKYYNNLKLDDIANAIGASKSSVKRYLASAQASLKRLLAD